MRGRKLKIGVASAIAGVSLAAGSLLLGAPWVSAQTPPTQPTPQRQQQPGAPGQQTPGQLQPGQRGGQESDDDCPRDENGNMLPRGGNTPGGTSFGSGARVLHQ